MPQVELDTVTIAYEVTGVGEPILLVCGCTQPAMAWNYGLAPALVAAGYQVITFDNRGIAPSSAPPAPYSVAEMVGDAVGLLDHLGLDRVRVAGHSMGGWIAETLSAQHPERVRAAALMGSCNVATAWEKAITTLERDLAKLDVELPPLFFTCETLRYLPNHNLQNDALVEGWIAAIGTQHRAPNPGRLGHYEACLAWSLDLERVQVWPDITVPCLVLAFEHDIDSPPTHARAAAAQIPGARYAEIPDASHLAVFTHVEAVAAELVAFFATT
jgi:pimeloyl-ACP methyl ester carboxylesterase